MKILILCSSPYVSLEPLKSYLNQAGLAEGDDCPENNLSFTQFHDQVLEAYEQDITGLAIKQAIKPGRVWQDMGSRLIHANLPKKQWYWESSKAAWLLDFWHELEPQHRYALIYSPPQMGISQALLNADKTISIDEIVESWVNYHFELLRFYRKHQEKCVLLKLDTSILFPKEFIDLCSQSLDFKLNAQTDYLADRKTQQVTLIEQVIFNQITEQYPEIDQLFQELEASSTPLNISEQVVETIATSKEQVTQVWQEYRQLRAEILKTQQENELILLQRSQAQEKLESQVLKVQETDKELKHSNQQLESKQKEIAVLQVKNKTLESKSAESQQENELMLLQLHQVQEELEHYFLKYQELEQDYKSHGAIAFIDQANQEHELHAELIQVKEQADFMDVTLVSLQWQNQIWPRYQLKIIKPVLFGEQEISKAAIKLPLQNDLLPLKTWPPQTADESGAFWAIDSDLIQRELSNSQFYPEDIVFLAALIQQLPDWLKLAQQDKTKQQQYYQIISNLQPALQSVLELQK